MLRCAFQPSDIAHEPLVFRKLVSVLPRLVFPPGGKVPACHGDVRPVDGKDVIHAAVEERAVVAYEDETLLCPEVIPQKRAAFRVEVVRGLVDEQKVVFPEKQRRKERPCALSGAQGHKRAVEDSCVHAHAPKFPQKHPFRGALGHFREHIERVAALIRHGEREIGEAHGGADGALVFIFAEQQV